MSIKFIVEKADGTNETAIDLVFEQFALEFTATIDGMNIKPFITSFVMK
jgi:hypothetical protein